MAKEKKCPFCGGVYGTVISDGAAICPTCRAEIPDDKSETKAKAEKKGES